ncbi:MAG: antibiotic biosynthesis monooxygenase [Candidatus Nanopelagicales bacterium]|nr:antibiotic biosynthesis monooxygenase [Candidatus Nanopelagicales bacterium]
MIERGAVAVIFTSTRSSADEPGYAAMAARMESLASEHDGFISVHSVRDPQARTGITVSYWRDDASARSWKLVQEHLLAQDLGRTTWYADYSVVVASVIRAYGSDPSPADSGTQPQ